ncbi:MAG TPA: ABC transporter permease [Thermoleophilaceae bacterium]|nr:ABC transporter permease [Thermoleophilaceae bacterium]
MNDFRDAITFIGDNTDLLWDKSVEQLLLSAAAIGVALVIAIPLGLWLGHLHRGAWLAINVANIGRALPSLAIIAIGIGILGLGFVNVMAALVVLAVPPLLTNTYVAIDGVDRDAVEAARAMGMRERQVLTRVELPLALPLIFAGIRTAAVYVVATAILAAIAGGGGLGEIIFNQASYRLAGVLAAAIWVSALALLVEGVFALIQRIVTPAGLRRTAPEVGPVIDTAGTS